MSAIRTLIVDDEALARERLREFLAREDDVELVGDCADGYEALEAVRTLRPELMFLDVQMPGLDGFDVVAQLDPEEAPAIIFATAYDEFAIQAFDANAIDYLLKPIGRERLRTALDRARSRARLPAGSRFEVSVPALTEVSRGGVRERFAVRSGTRYVIVRADELLWVEAADNYVRLHSASQSHLYRSTMADMEGSLDPRRFLRIHRSIIVNVDQVRVIEPWGLGEHLFVLGDGTKLTSSRSYRRAVRDVFGC